MFDPSGANLYSPKHPQMAILKGLLHRNYSALTNFEPMAWASMPKQPFKICTHINTFLS